MRTLAKKKDKLTRKGEELGRKRSGRRYIDPEYEDEKERIREEMRAEAKKIKFQKKKEVSKEKEEMWEEFSKL